MEIKEALLQGCKEIRQNNDSITTTKQNQVSSEDCPELNSLLNENNLKILSEKILHSSQAKQQMKVLKTFADRQFSKQNNDTYINPIVLDDQQMELTPQEIQQLESKRVQQTKKDQERGKQIKNDGIIDGNMTDVDGIDLRALIQMLNLNKPGNKKQWADEQYSEQLIVSDSKKTSQQIANQKNMIQSEKDKNTDKRSKYQISDYNLMKKFNKEQKNNQFLAPYTEKQDQKILKKPIFMAKRTEQINDKKIKFSNQEAVHKGAETKNNIIKTSTYGSKTPNPGTKMVDSRQKIDLATHSLPGLVKICYQEGIIKKDFFDAFIHNHRTENMLKFIDLFQKEDVDSFDFATALITIFQHRRLKQILLKIHPNKYKFTVPNTSLSMIDKFLKQVYQIQDADYRQIISLIDGKSGNKWWKHIQKVIQKKISMNGNKKNGIKGSGSSLNQKISQQSVNKSIKPRMNNHIQKRVIEKNNYHKNDNDSSSLSSEGNNKYTNGHKNGLIYRKK